MKFLLSVLASTLLLSGSVVSSDLLSSRWADDDQKKMMSESFNVPGKNPLKFCADPKDYILDIENVDLDPNPPKSGSHLTISASGTLSQDIEAGATVSLTVKYGLITLIHQTADLCDQVAHVNLTCPLKRGPMVLSHDVEIPARVPGGKYTTMADVLTKEGDKVTCLESVVYF